MLKEPVMLKAKSNISSLSSNIIEQTPLSLKQRDTEICCGDGLLKGADANKTSSSFYRMGSS
jgi:hypothetical protein